MKKKSYLLLFVIPCLLLCMIPSLSMIFAPSNELIGNENETPPPSLTKENGGINSEFPSQLGNYFDKHFAFRPQAITLDAEIGAKVFGISNLDTVTVGKDGWLYYAATLNDYLGRDTLTRRQANGIVHNLTLAQEFVEEQGGRFLFTIAPNKNTLYPAHMPYYYGKRVSSVNNRDLFHEALKNSTLHYCNLFEVFAGQEEELYLKQDSHWNNKGALMAYDAMLTALEKEHSDYADAAVSRSKSFYGDLSKMIYPAAQEPEFNYDYETDTAYTYETPTKSVEEAIIKTVDPAAQGNLYMYRDSFGNALLPYLANAYGTAYFTKAYPVNLQLDLLVNPSDTVIFEIAERNMFWFIEDPPVMPSPERTVTVQDSAEAEGTLCAEISEVNMQYIRLFGTVNSTLLTDDAVVYLRVAGADGTVKTYEAFDTLTDGKDGFSAYIPAAVFAGQEPDVDVIIGADGTYTQVYRAAVDITGSFE